MAVSIHDGIIIGYSSNFIEHVLCLNVKTVCDNIVTITFENYLAHEFKHVKEGSILFDIEPVNWDVFFTQQEKKFESFLQYAWPIWCDSMEKLKHYLHENAYKCFIICSSFGLNGYVFAKSYSIDRK